MFDDVIAIDLIITWNNREKQIFAGSEKFPVDVSLQSKPSYYVIKKWKRGDWIHPPFQPRKDQKLHFLDCFCLENKFRPLNLQIQNNNLDPEMHGRITRSGKCNESSTYLKIQEKRDMSFLNFSSEREASNSSKLHHPWLFLSKTQAWKESVEIIDSKNGSQSREPIMGIYFQNPFNSFFSGYRERRPWFISVGFDAGFCLLDEERLKFFIFPEKILLQ